MAKKVVFVDDSRSVLASVEFALDSLVDSGVIEFQAYANPQELLNDAKSGKLHYDMLFTDMNRPQMNGLDLSEALKKIGSLRQKPIIALTTEDSSAIKQRGKQIGIAWWIVKPFKNDKIVSAVKKVLGL